MRKILVRKVILIAIVFVSIACLVLLFKPNRLLGHRLELKVYVPNALGIKPGAPVRLAGVDVGIVSLVRPRTDLQGVPAEIVMKLDAPYELKIPNDSYVVLSTAGVLGDPFPDIVTAGATGAPATNGTVLKARLAEAPKLEEVVQKILGTSSLSESVDRLEKLVQERCVCKGEEPAKPQPGATTQKPPQVR